MIILGLCMTFFLLAAIGYSNFQLSKKVSEYNETIGVLEKRLSQISQENVLLVNADLHFAKQLNELNGQLISMDTQLQDLENKRDNDGSYQHALRILEMGGTKQEIVDSCHLSNAEAELLMNLQAYRSAINVA